MNKSQIAVFRGSRVPIELSEVTIPPLRTGEILVKIECTTLCSSDLKTFGGQRKEKIPTILGHEIVGRIARLGPQAPVTDLRTQLLREDDRITWAIYASDPNSNMAEKGIPQKGPGLFKYGHERISPQHTLHGGLAEYIILREHTPVIKLEENVPVTVAAIINCAVATVAGAFRLMGNIKPKSLLISGIGMLGMVGIAMAKTKGIRKVIAMDIDPKRLDIARRFGADDILLVKAKEYPAPASKVDGIIELSGTPTAMEHTLRWLNIGGIAVWVGAVFPQRDLAVNAEYILRNLITIKGLHNYNEQDFITAVEFIENHHRDFPFASLIHGGFTLPEVNEAFAFAVAESPFRVGIQV